LVESLGKTLVSSPFSSDRSDHRSKFVGLRHNVSKLHRLVERQKQAGAIVSFVNLMVLTKSYFQQAP
jgi:hypothetical protein